jgi:hypothetical protein
MKIITWTKKKPAERRTSHPPILKNEDAKPNEEQLEAGLQIRSDPLL